MCIIASKPSMCVFIDVNLCPFPGLTVADLVMPWQVWTVSSDIPIFWHISVLRQTVASRFVFIIGTSVVLALRSLQRKGVRRLHQLFKVTWRTVVLLALGFCFLNYSPRDGPRRLEQTHYNLTCPFSSGEIIKAQDLGCLIACLFIKYTDAEEQERALVVLMHQFI